jgi:nucleotide-binding universal stress UspA family protein
LKEIIRQKEIDLIVTGAHGRRGIRKVLLGSIAEQIFRNADCPVFTVGPDSHAQRRAGGDLEKMTFLFPTDFGEASLDAMPDAISYANQFGAKLSLLHVLRTAAGPESFLYKASLRMLQELTVGRPLSLVPGFFVKSASGLVSQKILETAGDLKTDLIIMGLRRFQHVEAASHAPWAMAYEVVCGAKCPVLTLRC